MIPYAAAPAATNLTKTGLTMLQTASYARIIGKNNAIENGGKWLMP
jgi:hypothetical protein